MNDSLTLLEDIEDEFREIVKGSIFIDEKRTDAICFAFRKRIDMLHEFINTKSKNRYVPGYDTTNDVKKDVQYSGIKTDSLERE